MTRIFDLDGTLLKYHTNEWLPGALEMLKGCHEKGEQVLLITARNTAFDSEKEWSPENTLEALKALDEHGVDYTILFAVSSPRILYCDHNPAVVSRETDAEWTIP